MKILQDKLQENHKVVLKKEREQWIDYTKAFACILVVLGHLLQGLKKANIPWNDNLYTYIDTIIYLFHMPLFMCLSGYLYSKTVHIESIKDYINFIKKKIMNLGIPFVVFYVLHIGINLLFSNSVNHKVGQQELFSMFTNPIPPFWFLYALFFIFLVIPLLEKLLKDNYSVVMIFTAILLLVNTIYKTNIYAIDIMMQYGFYFYLGVIMNKRLKKNIITGKINIIIEIGIYIILATMYWCCKSTNTAIVNKILAIPLAIGGIITSIHIFTKSSEILNKNIIWKIISKYTFQIYLLHTIFTAGTRIVLMKLALNNFYLQFTIGMIVGIVGPIIIAFIAEKSKYFNLLFYPVKTIALLKEEKNENSNDRTQKNSI